MRAFYGAHAAPHDGPRRRSLRKRLAMAARDNFGTAVFCVMLVACLALIALTRL